jgi:hypothetical protein
MTSPELRGGISVAALLHVLCCGLPLLIGAVAVGGGAALVGNPWVLGAAVVVVLGLVVGVLVRRARRRGAGCCPPEDSASAVPRPSRVGERQL